MPECSNSWTNFLIALGAGVGGNSVDTAPDCRATDSPVNAVCSGARVARNANSLRLFLSCSTRKECIGGIQAEGISR